jgi:teichuronic acid biosynthesis glycosyltransferase TuaC
MRVLTITTFFPNAADPQRAVFVKNLVHAMRLRCRVDVISPVPYVPPLGLRPEWRAQRAIPAHETIHGIDVAHPRFLVLPKLGWLSGIGYFLGVLAALRNWKRQLRPGDRPVVHAHCAYPDAVGVILAARLLGLPCVVTTHGSDINVYATRPLLRLQIRWALRNAAGVIAVSGGLQEKIVRLVGSGAARIRRIPCAGFDTRVFRPRDNSVQRNALGIGAEARVVVFVGQLVPIKGVEFLIQAWAALARAKKLGAEDRLILLGDGPLRNALAKQASDAGIADTVVFAGTVTQTEVACWVAAASLLCLPSRSEGTPNVVVEALASGVPVVASRVGGIPDLIRQGENGSLVPPADAAALERALEHVLAEKWDRQRIAHSVAHLTWRSIADRNVEFLRSAMGTQP